MARRRANVASDNTVVANLRVKSRLKQAVYGVRQFLWEVGVTVKEFAQVAGHLQMRATCWRSRCPKLLSVLRFRWGRQLASLNAGPAVAKPAAKGMSSAYFGHSYACRRIRCGSGGCAVRP